MARASAIAIAFVIAAGFRFLGLRNGFPNDHFVHLAGAQQILLGDWPTRDFVDPGLPLMFGLSAAAGRLLGSTLFAEGVLVALAFGAGAAFTVAAVARLTGSALLGLLAAAFELAVFPRTYGYPKILIYAAAIWLFGGTPRGRPRCGGGRSWGWSPSASCSATIMACSSSPADCSR